VPGKDEHFFGELHGQEVFLQKKSNAYLTMQLRNVTWSLPGQMSFSSLNQ
jgi:hypothetical protein